MMDEIGGIVDKADSQNRHAVICRRGGKRSGAPTDQRNRRAVERLIIPGALSFFVRQKLTFNVKKEAEGQD
jgi:hypothetical protein